MKAFGDLLFWTVIFACVLAFLAMVLAPIWI